MSATLITAFVFILLLIVLSLMASDLLHDLEINDPKSHNGLDIHRENFWNHTQPIRISLRYILPGTYKQWNLSEAGQRLARWLRFVAVAVILGFLAVIGAIVIENV